MAKMKNAPIVALAIAMMILLCAVVLIGDGNVAVAYAEGASTNEAQITTSAGVTTEYATLAEAVSALQNNDTLTLLGNATLESDVTLDTTLTFDLGTHTLSGTNKLIIGNMGVVKLNNGTVSCPVKVNGGLNGTAVYGNDVEDYGSISGGTFNGTVKVYQFGETDSNAISLLGGTYLGTVNNYGMIGHPNHKNLTLELAGTVNNYASILLGTFSGTVNNSAFISGGEFTAISTVNNQRLAESNNTNICIYGGTFKGEVNNTATTVDGNTITPKIKEYTYSPDVVPVFTETSTVTNNSIIENGDFSGSVANSNTISGGTFKGAVTNNSGATISGGTFQGTVTNSGTISGGTSTNAATITNNSDGTISSGTFSGTVTNNGTISGGTFNVSSMQNNGGTISAGTFTVGTSFVNDGGNISGGNFTLNCNLENKNGDGNSSEGIFGGTFAESTDTTQTLVNYGVIRGGEFTFTKFENNTFASDGTFGEYGFIYGGTFNVGGEYPIVLGGTIGSGAVTTVFNLRGDATNYASLTNCHFANESSSSVTLTNYGAIENVTVSVKVDNDCTTITSHNYSGNLKSGTFNKEVVNKNSATITDGTFSEKVTNNGTISGGTFSGEVINNSGGTISGGTCETTSSVTNNGTVSGGTFKGVFVNDGTVSSTTVSFSGESAEVTNNSIMRISNKRAFVNCKSVVNYGTLDKSSGGSDPCTFAICSLTIDAKAGVTPMVSNCWIFTGASVIIKTPNCIGAGNKFDNLVKVEGLDNLGQALSGSAFVNSDESEYLNPYTVTSFASNAKTVAHTHVIDSSTGLCECHYECPHAPNEGGLCSECGYQYTAMVDKGESIKYFKDLQSAFDFVNSSDDVVTLFKSSFAEDVTISHSCTIKFYNSEFNSQPKSTEENAQYASITIAEGVVVSAKATHYNAQINANMTINGTIRNASAGDRILFNIASGVAYSITIGESGTLHTNPTSYVYNVTNYGTLAGGCLVNVTNYGTITSFVLDGETFRSDIRRNVVNYGTIADALCYNFYVTDTVLTNGVENIDPDNPIVGVISGGTFAINVVNNGSITGGKFTKKAENGNNIESEPGPVALTNNGTISNGTFECNVVNKGTISGGTFQEYTGYDNDRFSAATVTSQGTDTVSAVISGGTFDLPLECEYTNISNGTFKKSVKVSHSTISGGTFEDYVENTNSSKITSGTFTGSVKNISSAEINGGTFNLTSLHNEGYGVIKDGAVITIRSGGTFKNATMGRILGGQFTLNGDLENNGNIHGGTFTKGVGSNVTVTNGSGAQITDGTGVTTNVTFFTVSKLVNNQGTIGGGTFTVDDLALCSVDESTGYIHDYGSIYGGTFTVTNAFKLGGNIIANVNNYIVFNMSANAENYVNLKYCKFLKAGTAESVTLINYARLEDVIVAVNVTNTLKNYDASGLSSANSYAGEIRSGTYSGSVTNASSVAILGGEFSGSVTNNGAITGGTFTNTSTVVNNLEISEGTFNGALVNNADGRITDGTFNLTSLTNKGTISSNTFTISGALTNSGTISGGTFTAATLQNYSESESGVTTNGTISDGEFTISGDVTLKGNVANVTFTFGGTLTNFAQIENSAFGATTGSNALFKNYGTIKNGTFKCNVLNTTSGAGESIIRGKIEDGVFYGTFENALSAQIEGGYFIDAVTNNGVISNGLFDSLVTNSGEISGGRFCTAVTNGGEINGGTFEDTSVVENNGTIASVTVEGTTRQATFKGVVSNNANATISGGTFNGGISNSGNISGGTFAEGFTNSGTISGGTFKATATIINRSTIKGGTFDGAVNNELSITNGTFNGAVANNVGATISGGTFSIMSSVANSGTISNGDFGGVVNNENTVSGGTFSGNVKNDSTISGGTFRGNVVNNKVINGGIFTGTVNNEKATNDDPAVIKNGENTTVIFSESSIVNNNNGSIVSGTFEGAVNNSCSISGGTFGGAVTNNANAMITGGTFSIENPLTNHGILTGVTVQVSPAAIGAVYVANYGRISGGTYSIEVKNYDEINGGTFGGRVSNIATVSESSEEYGTILEGTFNGAVTNDGIIGTIDTTDPEAMNERIVFNGTVTNNHIVYCGTFKDTVTNNNLISGGVFTETSTITNATTSAEIDGGQFKGAVDNKGEISAALFYGTITNDGTISEGTFEDAVTNNGTISGGRFNMGSAVINYGEINGRLATFIDTVENKNGGTITAGIFNHVVTNYGVINGANAIFHDAVVNNGTISNGNFRFSVVNNSGATISGGTFNIYENPLQNSGTINGGTFEVAVANNANGTISGGTFEGAVTNNGIITSDTISAISTYPKFTAAVTNYGRITSISASDAFSGANCALTNYGSLGKYVDDSSSIGLGGGSVTFNCPVTFESSDSVTALAIGCTFKGSVSVKVAESIGFDNYFESSITAVGFDNLGAVLANSAFVRDTSSSIDFVSPYAVTTLSSVRTTSHTHTYGDSTTGLCECGKECDHESANESGICATCGCQLQAKIQNTAGGSKNYMRLKDAVAALVDNDVLTVYCDVTYDADITINASCTINLVGKKLIGDEIPSKLVVIDPVCAKLIIASGKTVAISGTYASNGELNSSITVQSGATLILNEIKMNPDNSSSLSVERDRYVIENHGTIDVAEGQAVTSFALKGKLVNYGTIKGGEFSAVNANNGSVNYGTIVDAFVSVAFTNYGTISGGAYSGNVTNSSTVVEEVTMNGSITRGNFNCTVTNNANCVISGGTFNVRSIVNNIGTISGGTFNGTVNNNGLTSGETTIPAIIDKNENGEKPVFNSSSVVNNNGTIKDGKFFGEVKNYSSIENGTFTGKLVNNANGTISDGTFDLASGCDNYGTISDGTFNLENNLVNFGTITSGTFALASTANDNVIIENFGVIGGGTYTVRIVNSASYDDVEEVWTVGEIKGGTFSKLTENCGAIISGGTFSAIVSNTCENVAGEIKKGIIKGGTFNAVSNSAIISKVDSRFQPTFNGQVDNADTIEGGIFNQIVYNVSNGVISDGQFRFVSEEDDAVVNNGIINGGVFIGSVKNYGTIDNVAGRPVFNGLVINGNIIKDGVFNGAVENAQTASGYSKIEGGVFNGIVTNNGEIYNGSFGSVENKGYIFGGTFSGTVNNERKVQFVKNDLLFKGAFNNLSTGSIQDVKGENVFTNSVTSSGSIRDCVFYVPVVINGTSADVVTSIENTTFKNIVSIDAVGVIGIGTKFDNAVSIATDSEYATSLKDTLYGTMAFFKLVGESEVLQNADVKSLAEVFVKRHAHSVSAETGYCSCGYECAHENHSEAGVCDDCGYQLQVKITGESGEKYVKDFATAVSISEINDVLTLLCDVTITKDVKLDHFAVIELNGKSIGGNGRIITEGADSVVVIFSNSGTSGKVNVTVKVGAQVIVGSGAYANFEATSGRLAVSGGTFDNIKVNGATFEISGGTVGTLSVWNENANDVYISGGTFTSIELYGNLSYSDVLVNEYAYKLASDGTFVKLADMNSVTSVTVSACTEHAWMNGVCDYCGKVCDHIGGTATCTDKATCTNCGHEYGEINAHNHSALTEVKAVAATVTSTGNIAYYHCSACDKYYTDVLALHEITFAETIVQKLAPSIIEGNDGLFVKNSENGLTFKSDALKEDFIGVFVDGEEVAQDNYTFAEDGTEITLGAEYLGNLASGEHTLEIRSIGGGAVSAFTIQDAPSEGLSGGAWAGIGIAIAVAVIGLMFGLMYAFKRRA